MFHWIPERWANIVTRHIVQKPRLSEKCPSCRTNERERRSDQQHDTADEVVVHLRHVTRGCRRTSATKRFYELPRCQTLHPHATPCSSERDLFTFPSYSQLQSEINTRHYRFKLTESTLSKEKHANKPTIKRLGKSFSLDLFTLLGICEIPVSHISLEVQRARK